MRRPRGSRFRAIACVLGVLGSASVVAAPASAQDDVRFARGDFAGLVGIGDGRRLYLECHGRGRPTVVLEAGLRNRGDVWIARTDVTPGTTVVPAVARFTRVCVYDRPGTTLSPGRFSRSDPVPMPRTAADAVRDLHALLGTARIPGPYVLGGHSLGGLIVRLYAATHPRQVAGLVLVDALAEFVQNAMTPAAFAAFDALNNGPVPEFADYTDLERIPFVRSFRQMRRAARRHPLRGIPVSVISRGQTTVLPPGLPGGLTTAVLRRAWTYEQRRLARLRGARHVVARRSGHYVMVTQPGLVTREIRRAVRTVRRRPR